MKAMAIVVACFLLTVTGLISIIAVVIELWGCKMGIHAWDGHGRCMACDPYYAR